VAAATTVSTNCCIYLARFLWALLSAGYELRIATNAGKQKTGLWPWVSTSGPSHFQLARVAQLRRKKSVSNAYPKETTMQNIAEFRIIGRVGNVERTDKVTHVSVAANYNRKDGDEWKTDTLWNRVTFFRQLAERAGELGKGDLVHITGRVRQSSYESNGETRYSVDLIAEGMGILARGGAE